MRGAITPLPHKCLFRVEGFFLSVYMFILLSIKRPKREVKTVFQINPAVSSHTLIPSCPVA